MRSETAGQRPVHREHVEEGGEERDDRAEDGVEAAVEEGLDRLGVVGDAEGRVAAAPPVVEMERQELEVGIELGAQLQERLEADFDGDVIAEKAEPAREQVDRHHRDRREESRLRGAEMQALPVDDPAGPDLDDVVDDPLDRPVLEQIEINPDDQQNQAQADGAEVGPVIADDAPVEVHDGINGITKFLMPVILRLRLRRSAKW